MNPERALPEARHRISHAHVMIGLVVLGGFVRVWGLRFGLPLVLVRPDEQFIIDHVLNFFRRGDPNPHFFDYPTLYLYLLAGLYLVYYVCGLAMGWFTSMAQFVSTWPTDWVPFYMIGRVVGAASGTLSIWLVYEMTRRLLDARVAIYAAFFLSLAFLHVRDSHYGTTDVPMTCLLLAAMVFIVRGLETGRVRDAVLAGVLAGLATATKYNAAMLVVPMLVAAAIRVWGGRTRFWTALGETRLLWMAGGMALGFFVGSPYVLLDYHRFLRDMGNLSLSMARGMTPPDLLGIGWIYHARVSLRYGLGLPLLGASLLGLLLMLGRRRPAALILGAFVLSFYILTGGSYNVFVRYMVPIVPFLCVAAAYAADVAGQSLARGLARWWEIRPAAAVAVIAALLVAPSVASVLAFDRLLTITDSRLVAGAWVREHVPAGSILYLAGNKYGWPQPEERRPYRYEYWTWDRRASRFRDAQDRWTQRWPDWIIVHRSPLPYSHVPPPVEQRLRTDYALAHVEPAVDLDEPGNVYDIQDGFFMPFAGFKGVRRPGPNIMIYRRRQ